LGERLGRAGGNGRRAIRARLARLSAATVLLAGIGVSGAARAADLHADLDLLGQVREGDQSRETEAPIDLYGQAGAANLWGRSSVDTYFRLERTLGRDDGASDFYAGYARVPNALKVPGLDATLGRQFLAEGPGGAYVADAGLLRISQPGWPVTLSLYGGAPQYFEPTYSTTIISQDETLFGGNMSGKPWQGGQIVVGYQEYARQGHTLRRQISATATQSLRDVIGAPNLYGAVAYDADGSNLDFANAGASFTAPRTRLQLNIGGSYYKPQDQNANRVEANRRNRENTIFEAFSTSEMMQFRAGLAYPLTAAIQLHGDYSFQRYEALQANVDYGHIGSAGLAWLPGGDGLEIVRVDYFVRDSSGGNVNGIDLSYENTVYEGIYFRTEANIAYYEKKSNQRDVPVSTLVAVGYDLRPDLYCELNFEANRNDRFDADLRLGFRIAYRFRTWVPLPGMIEVPS
jgi:hypothetical protein